MSSKVLEILDWELGMKSYWETQVLELMFKIDN